MHIRTTTVQYKNRENVLNICNHQVDFGVPAERHFFKLHGEWIQHNNMRPHFVGPVIVIEYY